MTQSFDTTATISQLFVYPIKSCAGIALQEAVLTETGLDYDRAWMLVDPQGEFISQRELPRMALIQPQLKSDDMVLRAPGMLALHIRLDAVEKPCRATVWDDDCAAYDMGDTAAQWFTDFLAQDLPPGHKPYKLRLVRFDPQWQRLSNMKWTMGEPALNQFADGYPLLVTSDASVLTLNTKLQAAGHSAVGVERFRANMVLAGLQAHEEDHMTQLRILTKDGFADLALVKPCTRCSIPNVHPQTGHSSPAVTDMLQTYRQDTRMNGAITFGMNAIIRSGFDSVLRVGQTVQAQ